MMAGAPALWPTFADVLLRAEWTNATPARRIAAMLTEAGWPATKNSVLGRARRIGCGVHAGKIAGRPRFDRPRPDLPDALGCRFIAGEPITLDRCCNAPVSDPGSSWCAKHREVVFRRMTQAEIQAAAGVHKKARAA